LACLHARAIGRLTAEGVLLRFLRPVAKALGRLRLRGAPADLGRSGEGQRDHGRRQAAELLPELGIINAIPDIYGIVDTPLIK
jgi:hypothetical protein